MTTQICITVNRGSSQVTDDDRERAEAAALASLAEAGTTVDAAFGEFQRQWDTMEDQCYEKLTGLALVWVEAETAANLALTEGWSNPNGAECIIHG